MSISNILTSRAYSAYEAMLRKEVLASPVPKHIAVIMDGNRRYAEERGETREEGHRLGSEKLEEVLDWCVEDGVRFLTVYAFSMENFNREMDEVDYLMDLLRNSLIKFAESPRVHEKKVRLRVLGDVTMLPEHVREAADYAYEKTKDYSDYHFNMAIAYGGRQEIIAAVKTVARKVADGEMEVEDIDEKVLSEHMYASDTPDPDLVLRTSGEVRISNFLLWQLAYSELYFTDVYWPGFRYIDFLRAIRTYQQRGRRYGK
ncbi:MAG: polyprenyl diphosphate synthase [Candidatus Methanomethylophilaceae archaeon]|jgi:tritrans,polycis-undecaprenyl-diphosphate synthase [geranylgeranyl-diphosphate specific]|nr:polyprenyl diphosphate synthase [Candidatus Methanomethylophilaceae archaeon]